MTLKLLLLGGLAACAVLPASAYAQGGGGPVAPAAAADRTIDEVVVTARRREERLQDVPASVTALSEDALTKANVVSIYQLSKVAPSLSFAPAAGRLTAPAPRIRGLSDTTGLVSQDPTVGIYFAEAVMNRTQASSKQFYDLDSVQVLKGPQGTLFGRSTTGGAVLITPRRPSVDYGGYAFGRLGEHEDRAFEGALNLPVSDGLSVRLATLLDHREGAVRNLVNGEDLGGYTSYNGRVSATYRTGDFDTYLVADTSQQQTTGNPAFLGYVRSSGPFAAQLLPAFELQQALGDEDVRHNFPDKGKVRTSGLTNITTYTLGSVVLKNIASVRELEDDSHYDIDATASSIYGVRTLLKTRQISEEFQLSGQEGDGRLNYLLGLYYFEERNRQLNQQAIFSPNLNAGNSLGRYDSKAVYGQVIYRMAPKLNLTVAARYTEDRRRLQLNQRTATGACGLFDARGAQLAEPCIVNLEKTFREPTYTLSLDYKLFDRGLIYLTHRRGYRTGGFNTIAVRPVEQAPFDPEIVMDVEGGFKSDFSVQGAPTRINLAVFRSAYKDIQRTLAIAAPGGVVGNTVLNAASATITGLELEATVLPIPALELSGYAAVNRARYDRFVSPAGVDLSRNRFGFTPDFAYRLDARYHIPLRNNAGDLYLGASYRHQSKSFIADVNEPNIFVPAYGIADIRVDWENAFGRPITVSVFVSNVTDERYINYGTPLQNALGFTPVYYGERRQWSASARYEF